jgi:hypothetical protein
LNWVRVTRDPGVAESYERRTQAGAEWTLALLDVLRAARGVSSLSDVGAFRRPEQLALPLGEGAGSG